MLTFSSPHAGPAAALGLRLRRFLLRRRRLIAALLCCAAAGTAVQALLPADPGKVSLVVAAADLPAGALLTAGDLQTVPVAASAVPPDSFTDTAQLPGRRMATPLKRGSPVMQTSLVGVGLLTGAPPGSVAVAVRPGDPALIQLIAAGQLVDVILGGADGELGAASPIVLAADAPVLWTSQDGTGSWPGSEESGAVVVLAAAPTEAAALAAASGSGRIHLVLTGG